MYGQRAQSFSKKARPRFDLRGRCVSLTPVGRKLLKRAVPLWEKAQESIALLLGGEASAFDIRNKLAAIH
ncbi:MAG: hypothetical protein EBW52_00430 [Betaproteobacteria bacterium]|nr:hypothetical protein [Betaproteobacteria bacterium]